MLATIVIGAVALAFGRYQNRWRTEPTAEGNVTLSVSPTAGNAAPSETRSASAVLSGNSAGKASAGKATSDLAASLREAKDLRIFAMNALSKPQIGGITYAAYATRLCRTAYASAGFSSVDWSIADLPYSSPEDPRVYESKNRAYKSVKAACQSFSEYETGGEYQSQLLAQAKAQGDLIEKSLLRVKAALDSHNPSERKAALATVLENGDPLLISETLERLLIQSTPEGLAYWIDGKQLPLRSSPFLQTALTVLPCKIGLVCDERSAEVFMSCMNSGQCYTDRIEMVRAGISEAQRSEFDSLLSKLESGVKSRRADWFIP